ncbi:hypothetical protein AVCANL277_08995 [Campylobacter canadensis]|nr:hypothetical protein [Campylobacter canadensis]
MEFFLLHVAVLVTLFIALIKPKGFKKKLMWFIIWFFVCFGDIFIGYVAFYYNAYKYARNTYFEPFKGDSLYLGEHKVWLSGEKVSKISEYYIGGWPNSILPDFYTRLLLDNKIKYIEYKEVSEHPINNGKYFRLYSSNEDDKNCVASKELKTRLFFSISYVKNDGTKGFIEYDEFLELYNKYYKKYLENYNKYYAYWDYFLDKNIFHEKIPTEIKELITYLIQKHNMPLDRVRYLIKTMKIDYIRMITKFEEFYKNKCIARVQIDKNEVSRYEYVECTNSDYEYICDYPDIKDKAWAKFKYFAYIKDRNNNKKIAQSIFTYKTGKPFLLYSTIAEVTAPPEVLYGSTKLCNKNINVGVYSDSECRNIFIENFINDKELRNE